MKPHLKFVIVVSILMFIVIGILNFQRQSERQKLQTAFAKIRNAKSALEEAEAFDLLFYSSSSIELSRIDAQGDSVRFGSPQLTGIKILAGGKQMQHTLIDSANLDLLMRE